MPEASSLVCVNLLIWNIEHLHSRQSTLVHQSSKKHKIFKKTAASAKRVVPKYMHKNCAALTMLLHFAASTLVPFL
jgi:hypothetical protein